MQTKFKEKTAEIMVFQIGLLIEHSLGRTGSYAQSLHVINALIVFSVSAHSKTKTFNVIHSIKNAATQKS